MAGLIWLIFFWLSLGQVWLQAQKILDPVFPEVWINQFFGYFYLYTLNIFGHYSLNLLLEIWELLSLDFTIQ